MNNTLRYSFLALPLAFAGYPLYIFMPDFYATKHGLSLTLLGTLLLILRAVDAFFDPAFGYFSDKYRAKLKPLILSAAILLIVSLGALFYPISKPSIWFFVFMGIATLTSSFITINFHSFALDFKDQAQTKLTTSREAMSLFGILLALILINLFSSSVFIFIFIFLFWSALFLFPFGFEAPEQKNAQSIFIIKGFKSLFFVYTLSIFASSFPAILIIFFVRDKLGLETYLPLFLSLYFLAGAASMPLWNRLSKLILHSRLWGYAMLYGALVFAFAFLLEHNAFWGFSLICLLSGIAVGADLALPPAILGEKLLKHELETSSRFYFSILLFFSKLALALASLVALATIEAYGFKPLSENSTKALASLSLMYAAIPAFLKLIAAFIAIRRPL